MECNDMIFSELIYSGVYPSFLFLFIYRFFQTFNPTSVIWTMQKESATSQSQEFTVNLSVAVLWVGPMVMEPTAARAQKETLVSLRSF